MIELWQAPFVQSGDGNIFRREEDGDYTIWCHTHWDEWFPGLYTWDMVADILPVEYCDNPEEA